MSPNGYELEKNISELIFLIIESDALLYQENLVSGA